MSVKSRLRRLEAGVRWLETEGVVRRAEIILKIAQKMKEIDAFRARAKAPPPASKPKAASRVVPILRDAAVPAAPQDEVRSEPARPPPPQLPAKLRWTKEIRPGPHDVLTSEEALQVPWLDPLAEDDKA